MTSETKNSSINFGGSAIGGSIYFWKIKRLD
jgi:hypothetical protein